MKRRDKNRLGLFISAGAGFLLSLALSGQAEARITDADLVVSNATVELVKNTGDGTDSLAEISFTFSNTDVSGSGDEACTSNDDPLINTSRPLAVTLYSGGITSATIYLDFPITIVGPGRGESDTILGSDDIIIWGISPPVSDAELTKLSTVAGACYTESFHAVVSELALNTLITQLNAGHPLVLTVAVNDLEDTGSITIPAADVEIH